MNPVIGSVIAGKYEVKRLLGQGGMGAVYEGVHSEIGKRVAIKVIDPAHAGSEEVAARFRREARAASAVESDAIVHVFDVGRDPNVGLYMVMEFLTGEDLSQRLEREKRIDAPTVVAIGLQAARALTKAHAAGVVHRDLKPANLFLCATEDGSLKLKILDFGISKLARPDSEADAPSTTKALTRSGVVIGTPQYMSPEQAQGLVVDARSDVWSLGAVLYEAVAGISAFEQKATYEQTIIQIVTGTPKPLSQVAPQVPRALADVIAATLVHDIDARLQDCSTLVQRLVDIQRNPSLGNVVVSQERLSQQDVLSATITASPQIARNAPATAAGVTLPTNPSRSRAPIAIGAIVVAAALGLIAVLTLGPNHDQGETARPANTATATTSTTAPAISVEPLTLPTAPTASQAPSVLPSIPTVPAIASTKPAASSAHTAPRPSAATTTTSTAGNGQFGGVRPADTL